MERLATLVIKRRWLIVGVWLLLTVAGAAAAGKLADRWFESFSIPGFSAYEANQRALKAFGSGEQPPLVAVLSSPDREITSVDGVEHGDRRGRRRDAGGHAGRAAGSTPTRPCTSPRTGTRWSRRSTRPGQATFDSFPPIEGGARGARRRAPEGVTTHLTGRDAIFDSQGGAEGPSVLVETLIGGVGALVILLFVFGTLPAVLIPLVMAVASILTTFLCISSLTYLTDVSIIVQFLVALVGLGVSIDYALLMIFRFREELSHGRRRRRRSRRRWCTPGAR